MRFLALSCCRILCQIKVNFSSLSVERSLFLLARLTLVFYFLKRLSTILAAAVDGCTRPLQGWESRIYFSTLTGFVELVQFVYWIEHTRTPAHLLLNKRLTMLFKLSNAPKKLICQASQCLILTWAVCGDFLNHRVVQMAVLLLLFALLLAFSGLSSLRKFRLQQTLYVNFFDGNFCHFCIHSNLCFNKLSI